ncbi:MAG: 6-phosphogluconolactonase [Sorangiineae bacterium]|nr:6-phosphogluconolactonase [Polyangiaceae bacterium]MEB2321085.1 6-phosphogluconolactonase [Sorangiineae bacterium]
MTIQLELEEAHEGASRRAAALIAGALGAGGTAVLAGGRTPERTFQLLGDAPLPWGKITLVPSDERCLPVGHAERNDAMIAAMLGELGYRLHRFPAERGAEAAARALEPELAALMPFDVVLLGLGEDGHTASLFPGQRSVAFADSRVAPVHGAPKPPPDRVTLTLRALESARLVLFLVTGAGKREPLARLLAGDDIPAAWIRAADVRVIADRAAHPG